MTALLMVVILAGVILTIEKATAIEASLPHTNPQLPPSDRSTSRSFRRCDNIFLGLCGGSDWMDRALRAKAFRCPSVVRQAQPNRARMSFAALLIVFLLRLFG
jgi:hypothetical protein